MGHMKGTEKNGRRKSRKEHCYLSIVEKWLKTIKNYK